MDLTLKALTGRKSVLRPFVDYSNKVALCAWTLSHSTKASIAKLAFDR